MSDPEDSRNELTRRLRADKAVTMALTLQDLPSELILPIVSFLEIGGLLALRRVRFSLDKLTVTNLSGPNRLTDSYTALLRTNYSGGGLLRDLRPPLPRTLESRHLGSLLCPELEKAVLNSYMVEHQ